jgi:hypothetical protein
VKEQPVIDSHKVEQETLKRQRLVLLNQTESSTFYQHLIPNKHFKAIKADNERIYGGRFTTAGNLYYCSSQTNVMLFDTKDPYNFKLKAEIPGWNISWTISDMDIDAKE